MPTVPLTLQDETHDRYLKLKRMEFFGETVTHMGIYLAGLSVTERAAQDFLKKQENEDQKKQAA